MIMKLHHICLRISSANSSRFHSYRIKRSMRLHCLQRRVERQKLRSFRVAIILHFLPKLFKKYEIKEKSLLRITRNADIDTETIYDEDMDYRDAMENLVKQRKRMNPVRMEFSRKINKKLIAEICKYIHMDKNHVFMSRVPLDLSFVFAIQNYLRMQGTAKENLFYQKV